MKYAIRSSNSKRLLTNFISLAAVRGFDYLIPLITLPYLVRTIGLQHYGMLAFALSLALYFGAIIQYGFSVTAVREIARNRTDPAKLEKIYSSTLTASIVLVCISLAVFTFIVFSVSAFREFRAVYLYSFFFVAMQSVFPVWFFQGMEKMKYITYTNLVSRLLFLGSLLTLVTNEDDYPLVPLLNGVSAAISTIAALWIIKYTFNMKYQLPSIDAVRGLLSDGRHAFTSQLAPTLYNNSATFLLGIFTNNSVVGLFSSATRLIDLFNSISYLLSSTFLPYLSRNLGRHRMFRQLMLCTGLILTLSAYILSDPMVRWLFSEENIQVAQYVRLAAMSIFSIFALHTYSTCYLMLLNQERTAKNIALYTSLAFFILALLTIPLLGIIGALLTLVGARITMAAASYIAFRVSEARQATTAALTKSHESPSD